MQSFTLKHKFSLTLFDGKSTPILVACIIYICWNFPSHHKTCQETFINLSVSESVVDLGASREKMTVNRYFRSKSHFFYGLNIG